MLIERYLKMTLPQGQSTFLWGARKTGKSTYLKQHFKDSLVYDLLKTDEYLRLLQQPSLLRQEIEALDPVRLQYPIIIDEVQLIPELLNEVHWLIENSQAYFILCVSSARKLKRQGVNLLGGRVWKQNFYPLSFVEINNVDLVTALSKGLIPSHYFTEHWKKTINAYIEDYLIQEIKAEALVRNLAAFAHFLKVAAHANTQMINFTNIAQDCQIDSKTVKEYYQILVDTLLGYFIYPYKGNVKRKDIVKAPKFYFFDVGVVNGLTKQTVSDLMGVQAGHAFENYILMELMAYRGLNELDFDISYWRSRSGYEVDFVLGQGEVAIEVKLGTDIAPSKLKGLQSFIQSDGPGKAIVVCNCLRKRVLTVDHHKIWLIPWDEFLTMLWQGEII